MTSEGRPAEVVSTKGGADQWFLAPNRARNVRLPRLFTLGSLTEFLRRAYLSEPQPVRALERAIDALYDLGFWFTGVGLECRSCARVFTRSGNAIKHRCSVQPESLDEPSFEEAKGLSAPTETLQSVT
jgi:5-methylcytosine-specific restriction endonuclease McrA